MEAEGDRAELTTTTQQLCEQVCSYYLQLRGEHLPGLTQHIPQQFANIQRQILEVVELRKNMERVLEVEALQAQHFPTIQHLISVTQQQEETIARMAAHINQLQNCNITEYVDSLHRLRQQNTSHSPQIVAKGQLLVMELRDFKRTFTIALPATEQSEQEEAEEWSCEGEDVREWQQRRWQLARSLHSVRLRELNLRSELLEEREGALAELERGRGELIDTLLREKERDKNLRKKDNEKFGQIIKQRDQIQMQNENLNHSEKSLIPHLTSELLKLKNQLKQQASTHQLQLHKLNSKNDELAKSLQQLAAQAKAAEEAATEREDRLRERVCELQTAAEAEAEERRAIEANLRAGRADAEGEAERVRSKCRQLQHQNTQLVAKNQHLQSQYNELILKSSQLSHMRGELTQKFDKTTKKAQQLEAKLQEHRNSLSSKEQELRNLQNSLSILKTEKQQFQAQVAALESQLALQKGLWEERSAQLQAELTQNFILHNQERNNLLYELQVRNQTIAALQKQAQKGEGVQDIKREVMEELMRGEQARLALIDSFLGRMDHLV